MTTDTSGTWVGGSYVWADTGDWARLGQMMLEDGQIDGKRVLTTRDSYPPPRIPDHLVVVGSGVEPGQAKALAELCDAAIVGTWIKHGGDWRNPVERERVARLKEAFVAAER